MATILSGLASGFDWSSLVDKLIAVGRVPQNNLVTEKATLAAKNSALTSLQTLFSNFKTANAALNSPALYAQRSAALGNPTSSWSATAAAETAQGDYKFTVSELATMSQLQGSLDAGEPLIVAPATAGTTLISSLNLARPVTAGTFSINGARIDVATTDTLDDIFTRISAEAGVNASYDAATDRIVLSSADGTTPIMLGAANDSSNFLQALKLNGNGSPTVTSTTSLGVVRTTVPLSQSRLATNITATDGAGAGSFTINGVEIGYNVNADSVQNVLDRINASGAGVTATYDGAQDRFLMTNKSTGNLGISVSEAAGGFLGALGLTGAGATMVAGKNAEFTLNDGSTIVSQSNTLDATSHGVTGLSVTARSVGVETVSIGVNATSARAAIDDFVSKYNALQAAVDSMTRISTSGTTVTAGTLGGNREVAEMARSLRSTLFDVGSGNSGSVKRLADLGLDFSGTGSTLVLKDSAALDAKLAGSAFDVANYFSNSTGGLGKRLDDLLTRQLGSSGSFATQTDSITRQTKALTEQIAEIDRRLEAQRSTLNASFIQMETLQVLLQAQGDSLARAFPANKSSS